MCTTARTDCGCPQSCRGRFRPDGERKDPVFTRHRSRTHFQLDRSYSIPMQASVLDHEGNNQVPIMGCYGMGVTRLVAAVIEQNHDEKGITWPEPLAPSSFISIALNAQKSEAVREAADPYISRLTIRVSKYCSTTGQSGLASSLPKPT